MQFRGLYNRYVNHTKVSHGCLTTLNKTMFLSEIRNFSQKVRVRKPLRIFSTAGGTTTLLPDGKPDIPLSSTTTSIAQIILSS